MKSIMNFIKNTPSIYSMVITGIIGSILVLMGCGFQNCNVTGIGGALLMAVVFYGFDIIRDLMAKEKALSDILKEYTEELTDANIRDDTNRQRIEELQDQILSAARNIDDSEIYNISGDTD